jgi:selenide,water dikinase
MIRLTTYAHAAGCGCKIAPAVLNEILGDAVQQTDFKELLVGNEHKDDAAVWDLGNGISLINTVDFFMPIVDDPFDFGRIAAANAISDVYAMGGKPLFANAILGWPIDTLPIEAAKSVLAGAREICKQAGIPIAGGHSVDSKEPLFGLSVTGTVPTQCIKRNNTAKAGDLLFLTKPLGTGIAATALKRNMPNTAVLNAAVESMCHLNSVGEVLGAKEAVNAMTDITGFGLIGHLIEVCEGSQLSAQINSKAIPFIAGIDELLAQNCIPDNTYRNWNAYEKKVSGMSSMRDFQLLNDPQTSGGLLIAVDPSHQEAIQELLKAHGLAEFTAPIGVMIAQADYSVSIV